jgi:hypothetical protein
MTETAAAHLLEAVQEDSSLLPEEKETTLRLDKRDDYADVYTAEAGLARRLLAHPAVPVVAVTVATGDARTDKPPAAYEAGPIVGVRAHVPVGALQVKLRPRNSSSHAEIVTDRALAAATEGDS